MAYLHSWCRYELSLYQYYYNIGISIIQSVTSLLGPLASANYNYNQIRLLGLTISCVATVVTCISILLYKSNNVLINGLVGTYLLGDGYLSNISYVLLILTLFIYPVAILASWNNIVHGYGLYITLLLLLELVLIYLFVVDNLVLFYILFELTLLPLYLLIGMYGAATDRLRASRLLWAYTFIGSLCLLVGLIWLISITGTSSITTLSILPTYDTNMVWILIAIGILNKVPSVPLHIWLPRAHVQANVSTSIILAAIILKLSTYASVILLIGIMPVSSAYYSSLWLSLAIISYIHSSISTIIQIDSKILIAYSSVAHMSLITVGIHSNTYLGLCGAILLAVAHAFTSSALFVIFGQVLYDRLHNRVFYYIRSISNYAPSIRYMLLIAILANSGIPGSLNWLSELDVITGVFNSNILVSVIIATTIMTSALYSYWPYSFSTAAHSGSHSVPISDLSRIELSTLLYLLIPNYILGLNTYLIESVISSDVVSLLYN